MPNSFSDKIIEFNRNLVYTGKLPVGFRVINPYLDNPETIKVIKKFYQEFYINSPFPLAIIRQTKDGEWVNANYYDDPALFSMTEDFMISSLKKHISLRLNTFEVFVLGKKNAGYIEKLNKKAKLFDRLTVLEHPRFIQQYKSKEKQLYIDKYILILNHSE